ncbi:MAG: hypothetical protein ABL893_10595 [Hyphomicrobium sp.]
MNALVTDMPERERPISEQFRIVARHWVDAEAAAHVLEETKSAVFSQKCVALGDMPVNRAEQTVKASQDWFDHLEKIVAARREANLKKVQLEYLRMRHREQGDSNISMRSERSMSR